MDQAFRDAIIGMAPILRSGMADVKTWDDVKLLTVTINRSSFNELATEGTVRGYREAYESGQIRVTGDPNIQKQRFWVPGENRWITLRVSAKGIKTINKKGIEAVLAEMRSRGQRV